MYSTSHNNLILVLNFTKVWELLCFFIKEGMEITYTICSRFDGPGTLTLGLEAVSGREHSIQTLTLGIQLARLDYTSKCAKSFLHWQPVAHEHRSSYKARYKYDFLIQQPVFILNICFWLISEPFCKGKLHLDSHKQHLKYLIYLLNITY